jgi:hypothetical protein
MRVREAKLRALLKLPVGLIERAHENGDKRSRPLSRNSPSVSHTGRRR